MTSDDSETETLQGRIVNAAIGLYGYVFVLFTGVIIGWIGSNQATTNQWASNTVAFGPPVSDPPTWLFLALVPGIVALIVVVIPWPGLGSGGLSM